MPNHRTIKVGVLHSLSGVMTLNEKPLVDALLMALQEINQNGGIIGRHIEPIVADGASDPDTFANQAERLIKEENVVTIFGC